MRLGLLAVAALVGCSSSSLGSLEVVGVQPSARGAALQVQFTGLRHDSLGTGLLAEISCHAADSTRRVERQLVMPDSVTGAEWTVILAPLPAGRCHVYLNVGGYAPVGAWIVLQDGQLVQVQAPLRWVGLVIHG